MREKRIGVRDPSGAGYDPASGRGSLAVELVTTSVTSPGPEGTEQEFREREAMVLRDREGVAPGAWSA